MAIVYGQIDSLKRLREILDEKGISRFNSTGDINRFIKNYERYKEELFFKVQHEYNLELEKLLEEETALRQNYETLKSDVEEPLKRRIKNLKEKCEITSSVKSNNPVIEVFYWYKYIILKAILFGCQKRFKQIVKSRTQEKLHRLKAFENKVKSFSANRNRIISSRFEGELYKLEYERKVAKELNPLIAGAIGESLVANELKTLSEPCVVFNDYRLHFETPVYNRKEDDRIYSIQIDHLVVTKAGVFIIESKNWSKKSLRRLDLRSPVKQMKRSSYALFVILNGEESRLNGVLKHHHWGQRELPIRNVVAMINNKPNEKFRHVAVKKLDELNDYISYFQPLFDDSEVKRIADYLKDLKRYHS